MSLEELAKNRSALLLAEAAAWLHDMGKCHDDMLKQQASDITRFNYSIRSANLSLIDPDFEINLVGTNVLIRSLIRESRGDTINDPTKNILIRLLARCHKAAHVDKEETKTTGKQPWRNTLGSTVFGWEKPVAVNDLTPKLQSLPLSGLATRYQSTNLPEIVIKRHELKNMIKAAFNYALGDTRRPENEVRLWEWSNIVAALYKTVLADMVLTNSVTNPANIKWRFLSIRYDFAQFQKQVQSIPAWLTRRDWLKDKLDKAQQLLEVEYPLATEVYRDENGAFFVVPDLDKLLDFTNDAGKTLKELITQTLDFDSELVLSPVLDNNKWWGQAFTPHGEQPRRTDEIPPIANRLTDPVFAVANPQQVTKWWEDAFIQAPNKQIQMCTVSAVRPQGPKNKNAIARKLSDYWLDKTVGRASEWLSGTSSHETIWIDEIADNNGRLALLVGKFDLTNWLDGSLIKTLRYVDNEDTQAETLAKNASFARLNRIWETTADFWQNIENDLAKLKTDQCERLLFTLTADTTNPNISKLGEAYAYELRVCNINISVVHDKKGNFYTAENLTYITKLLGLKDTTKLKELLEKSAGQSFNLYQPSGYGVPSKVEGKFTLTNVRVPDKLKTYTPYIIIQAEVSTFMALVPADNALSIAEAIKSRYEQEMGKVRNRLPLRLGLVFAGRRTPFPALVDAGRRMLSLPTEPEEWEIQGIGTNATNPLNLDLTITRQERSLNLTVSTKMGDGSTDDIYYPYWHLLSGQQPTLAQAEKFELKGQTWVHIKALQTGDIVEFYPSRFDFDYLDTAGRRFEIYYTNGQRATSTAQTARPFYLEELEDIKKVWLELNKTQTSQIKNLEVLLETRRQDWKNDPAFKDTFSKFITHALRNVEWNSAAPEIALLEKAALSGLLSDTVELYMEILKAKPKADTI